MNKIDITNILENTLKNVTSHRLDEGKYCRWIKLESYGERNFGINAYGCADAANILYTLNNMPKSNEERHAFIGTLQAMQDPVTGYFKEGTHHIIHTTAHCTASLELFDALPLYDFTDMNKYRDFAEFEKYMAEYDWLRLGKAAHAGAGIYAAMSITGAVDAKWKRAYFDFFNRNCDSNTGLFITEPVPEFTRRLQIGDAFHYFFNYGDFHEALPYPEALIDSCLDAYKNDRLDDQWGVFGRQFHFIEMDWIYCLNRATYQTSHRFDEVKETLYNFAKGYTEYFDSVDFDTDGGANDMHLLFGTMCALAELQKALPGIVVSDIPTRSVLDRRPFI